VQALLLTWSSLCRTEGSSSEKHNFGKVIAYLLFGMQAEGEGMAAFYASDSGMASFFTNVSRQFNYLTPPLKKGEVQYFILKEAP